MSETEPPVIRHARDDPGEDASAPTSDAGGRRSGRLVLGLVLAALLVIVAAAGVRAVAQRVGTGSATGGGLVVADQAAVDRGVPHRRTGLCTRVPGALPVAVRPLRAGRRQATRGRAADHLHPGP